VIGAVVLGGDYVGLGVARSLGQRGIPVWVVDDERSITRFSRFAQGWSRVESLADERCVTAGLLDLRNKLGIDGWVLFPTRDEAVVTLSRTRESLAGSFRVPTPDWHTVRWAADKRNTYSLARELAIPAPRTFVPRHADDLADCELEFPVAVKPAWREPFVRVTKAKAWMARDRSELRSLLRRAFEIVSPGTMLVQEFIPGAGDQQYAYCAFFKDGQALGRMTVTRRRQHPPDFGRASTFVETTDVPELATLSERLLAAMSYYGLVEVEYKFDRRDGQFKLLDVNLRTWGYHSLGVTAGVDFPYLLYADQTGVAVGSASASVGVSWVRLITDVPTALAEAARGRLSLLPYIRSMAAVNTESVFGARDPLPGLAELALVPYLAVKRGW
jgi:D-aspartate ligase